MKDPFRTAQLDIYNMKQISFHSGRNPEFGMSKNRALYQTNEPNACAQCVWPWKIGRTNLTGTVCAAAMLLQKHSTHEEIRESAKVNYWVGSHNPAQTSSGSMIELWTSDGFEWFLVVNFSVPKICCPRSIQATHTHACYSEVSIRFFGFVVSKAICCGIFRCRPHVSM